MVDDSQDILNLIANAKEAIITLEIYSEDYEVILQQLCKEETGELTSNGRVTTLITQQ
ncbi:hypothetical protein WUBG_09569 [Wuchereria bancrofti]|uniref:Uncharacterized protein n=1 Tax=Wuchereria bancrofti TaxID=6293 RepID=J9EBL3_WUCBA|nr:hypothetical protein WUBG_09569 [Wuchereria bancrofti]